MEAYKSTCPDCGAVYHWHGYKTGLGKSKEQLKQMHRNETVCKKCGSHNLKTDVDRESELGKVYSEMDDQIVGMIANFIQERNNPNNSKPT